MNNTTIQKEVAAAIEAAAPTVKNLFVAAQVERELNRRVRALTVGANVIESINKDLVKADFPADDRARREAQLSRLEMAIEQALTNNDFTALYLEAPGL